MFFLGFILGLIVCFVGVPWLISRLYSSSEKMRDQEIEDVRKNSLKNQTVISFSYIMPLAIMALVFLIGVGAKITEEMVHQGHGDFIYFALVFPIFGFLLGSLYLKKMVES